MVSVATTSLRTVKFVKAKEKVEDTRVCMGNVWKEKKEFKIKEPTEYYGRNNAKLFTKGSIIKRREKKRRRNGCYMLESTRSQSL